MSKADYKIANEKAATFGNDKIVTGRNYRPSFAVSVSSKTIIVTIPIRLLEDLVKKLANSGENKEKTDFFSHFKWFENFTQSLKTKFNNCARKRTFYPGAVIIKEGAGSKTAYAIVEGTCNLVCAKTGHRFTMLEYEGDPTKKRRDEEMSYQKNFK